MSPRVSDVYYTALLEHVGCAGFAHEAAAAYGDELVLGAAAAVMNGDDLGDMVNTLIRRTIRGRGPMTDQTFAFRSPSNRLVRDTPTAQMISP